MRFGSLFSGIGGFDLGFERSGLRSEWQVEIDKDCKRVLSRHWPKVERFEDVSAVTKLPAVDVLCGGFPCQDLSVAGKREGLAGERSGLWFEFLRIARSSLPRIVVIENVPGLYSSSGGHDFATIVRGLVECGYCVAWRVLDAQYFGVAQRRRRVFIVGSLGNGSCAQILFESESVSRNPPTRREARSGVAATIRGGANGGSAHGKPNGSDEREMIIARSLAFSRTMNHYDESQQTYVTHALRSEGADASEDGTGRGAIVASGCLTPWDSESKRIHSGDGVHPALDGSDGKGGLRNPYIAFAQNTRDEVRIQGDGQISGALANQPGMKQQTYIAFSSKDHGADAGEISPTLRSMNFNEARISGGGQVAVAFEKDRISHFVDEEDRIRAIQSDGRSSTAQEHVYFKGNAQVNSLEHTRPPKAIGNFGVRRLTPRECERLQGFPDDWTRFDSEEKEISDSARYRMLGNAVAVPVAEWIGRRIIEATQT